MTNEANDAKPNKTKLFVGLSVVGMFLLSLYVAWTMSQNYRKEDTKERYRLTKLYKEWKKKEYNYDVTKGYTLYSNLCLKCHSANGKGVTGRYPSLADSPLVNSDEQAFIKIALHGLQGPITRMGQTYNGKMNGYKKIDPVDIAHLLNYIRNSFGSKNEMIHPVEIIKTHVATINQKQPYTEAQLLKPKEK